MELLKKILLHTFGIFFSILQVLLIYNFSNERLKPQQLWRNTSNQTFAQGLCFEGPCFYRKGASSVLEAFPENYAIPLTKDSEIILPNSNSKLEVILTKNNSRLSIQQLSVFRLAALEKTAANISTQSGEHYSINWLPGEIKNFALNSSPTIEIDEKPENQIADSEEKIEQLEGDNESDSTIYSKAPLSVAAQTQNRQTPLLISEQNIVVESPQRNQGFLALRWPLNIDFVFYEKDINEENKILRRWSLVKIIEDSHFLPITNFDMTSYPGSKGYFYQASVGVDDIGQYGLIPVDQKIDTINNFAVVFNVFNAELFKKRFREHLESVEKDSVKRLQVEP